MSKLLRITDRVLIGLSIFGEVLDEFGKISPTKKKWSHSAYSLFPKDYQKNNYTIAISRMLSSKVIEKVIVKGVVKLRISAGGKQKLVRDFPFLSFQNKKWDRKWRVVTFDIPIKKTKLRDQLRYKLKDLGFAMLQQSIWITPHDFEDDIREFLVANKLGNNAYLFVSDKMLVGDINTLVDKLWNISKINNLYKEAFDKNDKAIYLTALSIDPFLPKELLPKKWYGDPTHTKLFAGAN
jgi:phenylacetic acid degradation operon negative regulatory protein